MVPSRYATGCYCMNSGNWQCCQQMDAATAIFETSIRYQMVTKNLLILISRAFYRYGALIQCSISSESDFMRDSTSLIDHQAVTFARSDGPTLDNEQSCNLSLYEIIPDNNSTAAVAKTTKLVFMTSLIGCPGRYLVLG